MNKDLNLLCMSCFSPLPNAGAACPVCGYVEGTQAAAPHHLPIRTILNGKYLVGKALGEGGFGITYMGYDLNLDIKVAIKEYFPSGFATRTSTVSETVQPHTGDTDGVYIAGRERFVNEAKRLAHFRTLPGIVMVSDFFAENATAYIVMEYVEGVTLKAYLAQQGGKLPAERVINMLAPVFASLAQVHGSGIIHRDISPDNIMLTPDGSVKLLDFGAAREFSESGNKSLSVLLKHGYAPMEQYTTKGKQGPWTDVYALSATIYKAITGVTPESSMDRVMSDTLAPPSSMGAYLQPYQEFALMTALSVRPESRYQNMSEFYNAMYGVAVAPAPIATPAPVATPAPAPQPVEYTVPVQIPSQHAEYTVPRHGEPQSLQTIATSPAEPWQNASLRSHARNDAGDAKPKNRKPVIIAAAVATVVVIAIAVGLTLRGGSSRSYTDASIQNGEYVGDLDENGRRHGWGIWTYQNTVYEGEWENDLPNGWGTLYINQNEIEPTGSKIQGDFKDGYVDGTMTFTSYEYNGAVYSWVFNVDKGYMSDEYEVDENNNIWIPELNGNEHYFVTSPGSMIGGVPPFAKGAWSNPDVPPPDIYSNNPFDTSQQYESEETYDYDYEHEDDAFSDYPTPAPEYIPEPDAPMPDEEWEPESYDVPEEWKPEAEADWNDVSDFG